ncbi:MAG: prolyl oligopeptidase family serine peptidase [Gemmatimonadales bacterium]
MTFRRYRRWLSTLGLLAAAAAGGLTAQASRDSLLTVADYLDYERVGSPQVSPDGRQVIYTRVWVDKVKDRMASAIWIMDADGGRNRFLVEGSSPIWSPDGTRIAYVAASDAPKGAQIFVRWMDAEGATSQVTGLTQPPRSVRWSPDGKSIGFAAFVPKPNVWSIDLPAPPPNATWTPPPRVLDELHYRTDRQGFHDAGYLHLFVVPAEGGTPRQVTSGDWNVGLAYDGIRFSANWDWAPDGRTLYVDGLAEGDADLSLQDGNIYSVDLVTGERRRLTNERGLWTKPVVSPDGRWVAFVGHPYVDMTMATSSLYVMNADGSGKRDLSAGFDRDPAMFGNGELIWAPDGNGLYFAPEDRGSQNLVFAALDGSGVRPVTTGAQVFQLSSMSRAGVFFGTRATSTKPTDVVKVALAGGKPVTTQLTNVNDDLLLGRWLATVEEIWYPSTGGARIQGWIVKPPNFDPARRYPLLLEIHGGPQGMYSVGFDMMWQVFASAGYVVLYTNPRGSTGYGNAFMTAIENDYPGPDYFDLMAGVDSVIGRGYVDPSRLYVSGCSGGGILTSWVITHTTRFAGAAVRCPITNWISMAGHSDVPLFSHSFFEKPFWEDPTKWLEKSPVMHAEKVTTPTVFMTGVLDLRTPMAQSDEFYAALKMRGVPTKLLRFEGEWHGTESIPSNWMRTMLYMMSWFDQNGAKAGPRVGGGAR